MFDDEMDKQFIHDTVDSITVEEVNRDSVLNALIRLVIYSMRLDTYLDDTTLFLPITEDVLNEVKHGVEYMNRDILAMIVYVIIMMRNPRHYALRRNEDGNIFLDRPMFPIGEPGDTPGPILCTPESLYVLNDWSIRHINTPEQLIKFMSSAIPIGSARDFVTLLMTPSTDPQVQSDIWAEKYDSRYIGDWVVVHSIILKLKALRVFQYVLDKYPPEGCRSARIPTSTIARNPKDDIRFIYQQ